MNIINLINTIPKVNYKIGRDGYSIKAIVCHITGDSNAQQALHFFQNPAAVVSSHYIIEKDGTIEMCVDPNNKAYHCGIVNSPTAKIYFDLNQTNPNIYTIGIECVSSGEKLTDIQYKNLKELIIKLCNDFKIPTNRYNIIGHYELDSIDRKFDPISSYSVDILVNDVNFLKTINKLASSPDYWINNCIAGKTINGLYMNQIIIKFVNLFKPVSDFQSAINYLVSVKIISSPAYWITNCVAGKNCQGDYCKILIQNMGTKL